MKKQILFFILVLLPMIVSAERVKIGGLYYELDSSSKTASVTYSIMNDNNSTYCFGNVTIPDKVVYNAETYSVISIGDYAFRGCNGITSVSIPNSITSIGENSFWGCSGLSSISFTNNLITLGDGAFFGCSGMSSITIPNSVEFIGAGCFDETP